MAQVSLSPSKANARRSAVEAHVSSHKQHRYAPTMSGIKWNGVEWSGVEWSGVDWSGPRAPSAHLVHRVLLEEEVRCVEDGDARVAVVVRVVRAPRERVHEERVLVLLVALHAQATCLCI